MTEVLRGERLGKTARLRLGCSAVLFSDDRAKVLLTRRSDNGLWCLPGGMVEAGETVAETCVREVFEETGLQVHVKRLTGVYSNPDLVTVYPDGNRNQVIVLTFEVELVSGEPGLSDETIDIRYFPVSEAVKMDLFHDHVVQLRDALAGNEAAYLR